MNKGISNQTLQVNALTGTLLSSLPYIYLVLLTSYESNIWTVNFLASDTRYTLRDMHGLLARSTF